MRLPPGVTIFGPRRVKRRPSLWHQLPSMASAKAGPASIASPSAAVSILSRWPNMVCPPRAVNVKPALRYTTQSLRPPSCPTASAALPHKENPMPAKRPAPRLVLIDEAHMNDAQRALLEAIRSGPRGKSLTRTGLPPRLSEFAILCTARLWRAQYEWFAHAPMAEKAGVKTKTIAALRATA